MGGSFCHKVAAQVGSRAEGVAGEEDRNVGWHPSSKFGYRVQCLPLKTEQWNIVESVKLLGITFE